MFTASVSNPQVRLGSITNTQGSPLHRLTILPSQNSSSARPLVLLYHFMEIMMKLSNIEFTAFVGLDWADSKHDICVQAAACEAREFDRFPHKVAAIDE